MSHTATLPFHKICALTDIPKNTGVCACVDDRQIAVYRLDDDRLFALNNFDPFSKANVLSRGIVGTKGEVPKVASPIYKQSFSLLTGECLDDPTVTVDTYLVREQDGEVYLCGVPQG